MMPCAGIFILTSLLLVVRCIDSRPHSVISDEEHCRVDTCERGRHDITRSHSHATGKFDFDHVSDADYELFKSLDWRIPDEQVSSLRQILMIHRHGDRTPFYFPSEDNLGPEPFWQFHGLAQLTNRGKARMHMLGQIMRQRYDAFLNGSVSKLWRESRASGAYRCIESAEVFLSSFLNLDASASSPDACSLVWAYHSEPQLGRLWQPANVMTMNPSYDALLNDGPVCATVDKEYERISNSTEARQLQQAHKHEAEVLMNVMGFETDAYYKWFWASSQLEVERSYFGERMKPELLRIYDRVQDAGTQALALYQSTRTSRRLRAGLLINHMISHMQNFSDPNRQELENSGKALKFVHYSAHDMNLVLLLGMLNQTSRYPTRPDYASNIVLELHELYQKSSAKSDWYVKIFYMPRVPAKPKELHLEECERDHPSGLCSLNRFDQLMAEYKVDSWQIWMRECNNDLSKVDPYVANT